MPLAPLIAALALAQQQPADDFAAVWKQTETAIRGRYYDRLEGKERMDALLAKYGPIASKATGRNAFRDAVVQMIREFGDSHFDFLTPSDQGFYSLSALTPGAKPLKMPHVGAWFGSPIGGGYPVRMVLEGMAAEKAGLKVGDVVTQVDGKPFTPVDSLKPLVGKEAEFSYVREGHKNDVSMEVEEGEGMDVFLQAGRNSGKIIERDGKKYGYYHLWTMAGDQFRNALSAFVYGRCANTDGFILDIRDGFGGRPEGFGDPFFRPEVQIESQVGEAKLTQIFGYQKPLVVIINGGSRSAKEMFAYIMKKSKRATLVGQPTAGHVLGTSPALLNDWAILEIPMVDFYVDGIHLEGHGVDPDFLVLDSTDAQGNDLYLERALDVLKMAQ